MRGDDRLMLAFTGVVIAVAVGFVVRQDFLREGMGFYSDYGPRDDRVTLGSARAAAVDVVANDEGAHEDDGDRVLILSAPSCGTAYRAGGRVIYQAEESCGPVQRLSYCVPRGDACPGAEVTLRLEGEGAPVSDTGTPVLVLESGLPPGALAGASRPGLGVFLRQDERQSDASAPWDVGSGYDQLASDARDEPSGDAETGAENGGAENGAPAKP